MRRLIALIAALFALLALASPAPAQTDVVARGLALQAKTAATKAVPVPNAPATPPLLPGARFVAIGDSIAQGLGSYTTTNSYDTINSLYSWANTYAEARAFIPPSGNKGIGGQSIATIAARFTTDLSPLAPAVILADGGYNDTCSLSAAQIIGHWDSMISQAAAMGAYLIVLPITPGTTQTGACETVRLAVNAALATRASPTVFVVDIGGYDPLIHTYAEALPPVGYRTHPNVLGAQLLGQRIAQVLRALIQPRDPSLDATDARNMLGTRGGMPGTGGTLTTGTLASLTGQVATGWAIDGANGAGATVVASKLQRGDGSQWQQLKISGTYTGSGKGVNLTGGSAPVSGFAVGDMVEITYELEFDAGATNVDGVGLFAFAQSSGYAFLSQASHMVTNTANNSGAANPGRFRGVFRAMALGSPTTAPAFVNLTFTAYFREGGSSSPVAATFRIGRVAIRKL